MRGPTQRPAHTLTSKPSWACGRPHHKNIRKTTAAEPAQSDSTASATPLLPSSSDPAHVWQLQLLPDDLGMLVTCGIHSANIRRRSSTCPADLITCAQPASGAHCRAAHRSAAQRGCAILLGGVRLDVPLVLQAHGAAINIIKPSGAGQRAGRGLSVSPTPTAGACGAHRSSFHPLNFFQLSERACKRPPAAPRLSLGRPSRRWAGWNSHKRQDILTSDGSAVKQAGGPMRLCNAIAAPWPLAAPCAHPCRHLTRSSCAARCRPNGGAGCSASCCGSEGGQMGQGPHSELPGRPVEHGIPGACVSATVQPLQYS